jgi:hypothetical protein
MTLSTYRAIEAMAEPVRDFAEAVNRVGELTVEPERGEETVMAEVLSITFTVTDCW